MGLGAWGLELAWSIAVLVPGFSFSFGYCYCVHVVVAWHMALTAVVVVVVVVAVCAGARGKSTKQQQGCTSEAVQSWNLKRTRTED